MIQPRKKTQVHRFFRGSPGLGGFRWPFQGWKYVTPPFRVINPGHERKKLVHRFWSNMGVSKDNGTPKSSYFNRVFHYKPSILGAHPYFWKHPYSIRNHPFWVRSNHFLELIQPQSFSLAMLTFLWLMQLMLFLMKKGGVTLPETNVASEKNRPPQFISHEGPFGRGPTTRSLGDNNDHHGLLTTYVRHGMILQAGPLMESDCFNWSVQAKKVRQSLFFRGKIRSTSYP